MDTSILVTLGFILATIGIVFVAGFLRRKGYVAPEDLVFAINVLKISSAIIDELNLKQETQIKAITNLIVTSLKMADASMTVTSKEELITAARANVYKLCETSNIKITPERVDIIDSLLLLAFNNSYAEKYVDSINDSDEENSEFN